MKILTFKRMVGLAAIGGAAMYVRKHGGIKNAYNELMKKTDNLLKSQPTSKSSYASTSTSEPSTSSYVGSSKPYDRH